MNDRSQPSRRASTTSSASSLALGTPHAHHRRIASTNARGRALAAAGAPHGTLVTAFEQTAGRGRQGREWWAPAGDSLLMSLVLRDAPPLLALAAAVAVCDAVGDVPGESVRIKWPNDITFAPALAKLAGILVEGRPQDHWTVLGIGVNVAVSPEAVPAPLRGAVATLGRGRDAIEPLMRRLLEALEYRLAEPAQLVLEAWRARDALRGRAVSWTAPAGTGAGSLERGRAQGIDGEGRLIVVRADGARVALAAGEVHLLQDARQTG